MSILPTVMPVPYEIVSLDSGRTVIYLDNDGNVYAKSGHDLEKSVDFGANWTTLHTFANDPQIVRVLPDDSIIVSVLNVAGEQGKIYRSTDAGSTFTEVMEFDSGYNYPDFGLDAYDKIVVTGAYGGFSNSEIHLSQDYGATWTKIFSQPYLVNVGHIHDVCFDPYEGLIWATAGDGHTLDMVYWSGDYGVNWEHLEPEYHVRATQIIPLPDCVLFVSDEKREACVYKYTRNPKGTVGRRVRPEKVFFSWPATTIDPDANTWGTDAAVVFGQNACAYFGYRQGTAAQVHSPAIVYKTDGTSFVPVWIEEKLSNRASGANGVGGVWGPDKNGIIVASILTTYSGKSQHLLKLKLMPS